MSNILLQTIYKAKSSWNSSFVVFRVVLVKNNHSLNSCISENNLVPFCFISNHISNGSYYTLNKYAQL